MPEERIRYYDKDDTDTIAEDGEVVRVPMDMMDAVLHQFEPIIERDLVGDAFGAGENDDDDGGNGSREAADAAYARRSAWLQDAWKNPAPASAKKPDAVQPPKPQAAGDAAAQRASANAAWERKKEWLRNAWKAAR